MPNPDEPPRPASPSPADHDGPAAEQFSDASTEVLSASEAGQEVPSATPGERRFTAPSAFDARLTQIIDPVSSDPATELIQLDDGASADSANTAPSRVAVPQSIPPRDNAPAARHRGRWGWVLAVVLVIAAIAAVAILATMLVKRADAKAKAARLQQVRDTIQNFDGAIQRGDLATLRGITCGETAESYNKYDNQTWADTHTRVAAAGQYPVVASIDEVVVNGNHAEANVTSFMASDPATLSTRSFDLQFRDEQWKICQAPGG